MPVHRRVLAIAKRIIVGTTTALITTLERATSGAWKLKKRTPSVRP
jgi:hypothetical protein